MGSISELIEQLKAAADGATGSTATVPVDLLREAAALLTTAKARDPITWSEGGPQKTVGMGYKRSE